MQITIKNIIATTLASTTILMACSGVSYAGRDVTIPWEDIMLESDAIAKEAEALCYQSRAVVGRGDDWKAEPELGYTAKHCAYLEEHQGWKLTSFYFAKGGEK